MIRLLIVDDVPILRDSLKYMIEHDEEIRVVGTAGDGFEAFNLCDALMPDIVLMDIMMPNCDGVEGTRLIKTKFPQIKIIILTTFKDDENVSKALKNGADGYVLKDIEAVEIGNIIKNVYKGFCIIQKEVISAFGKSMNEKLAMSRNEQPIKAVDLTKRENEIVKLLVEGKSYREMAAELYISEGTARNMISDVIKKLDLKDRVQLAIYAVKNKIV